MRACRVTSPESLTPGCTVQALIGAEAAVVIGADRQELSPERDTYHKGHRRRTRDTRVGRSEPEIP